MADTVEHRERSIRQIAQNRKARHDYQVVDTIETGIVLQGTEVKSLREGKCQLQDSYARFRGKEPDIELWLMDVHISPYFQGNINNHEPRRPRKLLLKKKELLRLQRKQLEKGITLVPLSIYFSGPFVKIELGLVRGKRQYDKREDLKRRDDERRLQRMDY